MLLQRSSARRLMGSSKHDGRCGFQGGFGLKGFGKPPLPPQT